VQTSPRGRYDRLSEHVRGLVQHISEDANFLSRGLGFSPEKLNVRLIVNEMALEFLWVSFAAVVISLLFHTLHRPLRYAITLTRRTISHVRGMFKTFRNCFFFIISSDMPATEWSLSPSKYSPPALTHRSQRRCHFWKQSWYVFFGIARSSVCEFSVIESSEIAVFSKWIWVWEIRKSLPEWGQVSRMAEEAQLCSCWPESH
jgi:hypothetical protein